MNQDFSAIKSQETLPEIKSSSRSLPWIRFGAIAVLLTAGTSIAAGLWLGLMLLLDPNSILWLNRFLPQWGHVPIALTNPLQTLPEIQAELEEQQFSLGAEFPTTDENEVVMPVWQTLANCTQGDCQAIAALRVYFVQKDGKGERSYSLLNELRVGRGQFDTFAELNLLPIENEDTTWLSLEGVNMGTDLTAGDRYGLLVYYDPQQNQLNGALPWQSRAGRSPQWQNILGDDSPELLIDQSRDSEPEFSVYRLNDHPTQPTLFPVSLDKSAIALPAYEQAIALARLKLWAIATQQLQQIKTTITPGEWTPAAEDQREMIAYHGALMAKKCEATTLNIGQKIKHCLRAGDVNEGLRLLNNHLDDPLVVMTVTAFLETDGKDLQRQLDALHQLDPFREAVTIWQFLSLTAQQGSQTAIASLKAQQQIDPKLQDKIEVMLGRVENTLSQQARPFSANSKLIGKLQRTYRLQPQAWLQPEGTAIALNPNKNWYTLEVSRFFDGKQWQQVPFNLELSKFVPGQSLWQILGLDQDPQIMLGQPNLDQPNAQSFGQARGVQFKNGKLTVLVESYQSTGAIAENIGFGSETLRWLNPDAMTIQTLAALEPAWVDEIVLNLWRHLRASDLRFESAAPPVETLVAEFGALKIQPIELTGNNHPEARVTVYLDSRRKLALPNLMGDDNPPLQPYHLIFGDTGELIYSELGQSGGSTLAAIADLQDGGMASLVLRDSAGNYTFKRWQNNQRTFKDF